MTDETKQPEPTTGPTPAPTLGPTTEPASPEPAPVWSATGEAGPTTEAMTASGATPPPVTPPPVAAARRPSHAGRDAAIAVLVVGAILAIGGISFAAGRASNDDDGTAERVHRMDVGDQYRGQMPNGQMPNRGMFPGQGDGDGFRHGDRSGGRQGRGGEMPGWQMPGDGAYPGWQMPGDGWQQPNATQGPGATQAPSPTEVPSASPSTTP